MVFKETLEGPLDCKEIQLVHHKGNQSWIFIGRTDAEAEAPILGHLMGRTDPFEKTLMLGKIEGRRRRGRQRMKCLDGITNSMDMSWWVNSGSWWWTGRPGMLQFMGLQRVGHGWATELTDWNREYYEVKWKSQLCPTLCNSMDYTVHGILQAGILELVAFPFSRGSSQPRYQTQIFCIAGGFFTSWATREAQRIL